jgi:hypothetical protein
MEETINMADQTTQGIANKLTSIRTRIRDKSEILKQHQQLVCIRIYIKGYYSFTHVFVRFHAFIN